MLVSEQGALCYPQQAYKSAISISTGPAKQRTFGISNPGMVIYILAMICMSLRETQHFQCANLEPRSTRRHHFYGIQLENRDRVGYSDGALVDQGEQRSWREPSDNMDLRRSGLPDRAK